MSLTGGLLYLLSYDGEKVEQCAGFEPAPYGLEDRHAWPLNTSTARKRSGKLYRGYPILTAPIFHSPGSKGDGPKTCQGEVLTIIAGSVILVFVRRVIKPLIVLVRFTPTAVEALPRPDPDSYASVDLDAFAVFAATIRTLHTLPLLDRRGEGRSFTGALRDRNRPGSAWDISPRCPEPSVHGRVGFASAFVCRPSPATSPSFHGIETKPFHRAQSSCCIFATV